MENQIKLYTPQFLPEEEINKKQAQVFEILNGVPVQSAKLLLKKTIDDLDYFSVVSPTCPAPLISS